MHQQICQLAVAVRLIPTNRKWIQATRAEISMQETGVKKKMIFLLC